MFSRILKCFLFFDVLFYRITVWATLISVRLLEITVLLRDSEFISVYTSFEFFEKTETSSTRSFYYSYEGVKIGPIYGMLFYEKIEWISYFLPVLISSSSDEKSSSEIIEKTLKRRVINKELISFVVTASVALKSYETWLRIDLTANYCSARSDLSWFMRGTGESKIY